MAQTAAAGALFLYTEWNKDKCGLTGFHRRFIQEFCARKAQSIKAYSTVLNTLKPTDDQVADATRCGVTLIPALLIKFDDSNDPEYLMVHNIHCRELEKLEKIQYVVGYAPKTGFAAAAIKKRLFPDAKLVLINHVCPEEKYLLLNVDEQKLANIMLKMASEADILFSIGPKTYEHFEKEYKANFNQKQLSDIPHEEIFPKPEKIFFDLTIKNGGDGCNILTYGECDTPETLNKNQVMAESIGKAAYHRNECYCSLPCWRIQGISPNAKEEDKNKLIKQMKSHLVDPKFYSDCSVGALMTTLQQADFCVPSPYYKDYACQGLEAIVAGLPTMAEDNSQLAYLMIRYFEDYADDCIIRDPKQNLYKKILWTMRFPDKAFKKAAALKKTFQEHALLDSAKFTALLTNNETLQPTQKNNTVPGVEEKQKTTSEKTSKQQQTQAVQHEYNVLGTDATQGALTTQFSSSYAAPGKAENPRSQNTTPPKSERSQQEGTHLETENPSQTNMKRQHTSSGKNDRATEAKKRKQEFQEQPIKIDDTMPQQGGTGFIQHNNKAVLGENTETGETSELQRTKGSQSEMTEIDVTQGTQKTQSQPMTTCARTGHNPHKTMTLHKMVEPESVSGKCEETQPEKAVQSSNGVENPGEMKSQMETGGEHISEKHTGTGEEAQGSNILKCKLSVDKEPFVPEESEDADSALTECQERLLQIVIEMLADERGRQKIADICKYYLGVDLSDLRTGCLEILLELPGLYNLYRLKQTCKSTNLAKAFEPLLITDEMREIAAKVGVPLQLKATYNKESFKEVELFFINRDGGGVKPIEVYTYFERKDIEEILFDADGEDDSMKTEEKVAPQQASQTEVDMTVEDYTYFERKTIEEKDSDADGEDDSMKTEEKVTPHQVSQAEVDITGEKPSQLLLLEVDPKAEIQDSAEKYAPLIFNSGIYTRWKGKHYDMMQLQVKMTGQVQHILSCRPEILALLGVRNYLLRDTDVADLSNTDLEEQITESGRPILSRVDVTSFVSTQARSLLLCDTSPKQHKKYDISYYLDLAQVEVPSLAMKVSKLEQMLHTSLNEKSKFEKGSSEIKKKLEEQIVSLQTEKEILENQLAVLENQNIKSTLDRESAERVAAQQLTDILSLKNEIRALKDRIKDKDKTIDDFKYELSQLSDEKQDAELQEKIAEIPGEDYPLKEPEKGVSSDQTESGVGASQIPIPTNESPSDLFTKRLFDLAQEITDAKLEELKYLCKGNILSTRELESLRHASSLFNMLCDKNLISESNTALLKDMLCQVGLNPLVEKYFKPSTYQGVSYDQMESGVEASGSTLEPIPPNESPRDLFSKRLSDLAQEITDAKFEDLKLLCKDKLTH